MYGQKHVVLLPLSRYSVSTLRVRNSPFVHELSRTTLKMIFTHTSVEGVTAFGKQFAKRDHLWRIFDSFEEADAFKRRVEAGTDIPQLNVQLKNMKQAAADITSALNVERQKLPDLADWEGKTDAD